MRLYRVSASTGLPAGSGEPAIFEAYKPGTEPGQSRNPGSRREPSEEEMPIASTGEPEGISLPTQMPPSMRLQMPLSRGAPASGTGGLY